MKASTYVGVWIDHALARIVFHNEGESPRSKTILSHVEPRHRSIGHSSVRPPHHVGGSCEKHSMNRREVQLHRFYDQVIEELRGCKAVAVMGPGEAKGELLHRIATKRAARIPVLKIERVSRLTDHQILERLRKLADCDATWTKLPIAPRSFALKQALAQAAIRR
jgi:hypothetical protein